ncbi:MAG: sulfatase-like hydrolase/transferase [Bacillota bacterium]
MDKPNILIVLAEDICPNLGCYGDENAKTPYLDQFAKENFRFTNCYSAGPVCSAARTSLNLGINGPSAGVGNHRSYYELPEHIKNFGNYMQEQNYHTIIGKTDLNFPLESGYDELIPFTRDDTPNFAPDLMKHIIPQKEKPVFIIQTMAITHQSQYGYTQDRIEHRETMPRLQENEYQTREDMVIPGYHFKSLEADEVWAQYHEKMTSMDRMFGELVEELKKSGTYENTILIFAGDNGHGIPSGKSYLWNEGVHVPMLLHVPKKMESQLQFSESETGKVCTRLTSFVDYLPTALSVVGGEIPNYLEGKPILGERRVEVTNETYSFGMRIDEVFENSRCVHEHDLMYVCDFALTPTKRPNAYQTIQAPWFVRSMIEKGHEHKVDDVDRRAFFRQMPRVTEQLFQLDKDKFSLHNCAEKETTENLRMRQKMLDSIKKTRDSVFLPEALILEIMNKENCIPHDVIHNDEYYPIEKLMKLWTDGIDGVEINPDVESDCEKIWVTKILNNRGERFDKYLHDASEVVSAYTAYRIGNKEILHKIAKTTNNFVLILFIIDMISNTREKQYADIFQTIVQRNVAQEKLGMHARFVPAMDVGMDMLSLRISSDLVNEMREREFWSTDKHRNVQMVLDELDLY